MNHGFRVWAKSNEYPKGHMFYVGDCNTYKSGQESFFMLNQNGDLVEVYEGEGQWKDRGMAQVWARVGFNDIHVLFKTGLKDKNGKEIYEGDIVVWDEQNCEVKFDNGMYYINPFKKSFGVLPLAHADYSDIEVIGNIYENNDLLHV